MGKLHRITTGENLICHMRRKGASVQREGMRYETVRDQEQSLADGAGSGNRGGQRLTRAPPQTGSGNSLAERLLHYRRNQSVMMEQRSTLAKAHSE